MTMNNFNHMFLAINHCISPWEVLIRPYPWFLPYITGNPIMQHLQPPVYILILLQTTR